MGSLPDLCTRYGFPPVDKSLNTIKKCCFSYNLHVTIETIDTSCRAGHYFSSQGSHLGKTMMTPPTPIVCLLAPSSTMRASQQTGSFLVSTYLIFFMTHDQGRYVVSSVIVFYCEVLVVTKSNDNDLFFCGSGLWYTSVQLLKRKHIPYLSLAFYLTSYGFQDKHNP